ncbi:GyrI-like domain-containing protein [Pannonibacter phragmitetus]|uniref:GyrI-like domain-containing protein n=1 Tax=Pannonibacter phragmitetus TaxID=121719 RepID=UPI003D2EEEE2
MHVRHTTSHDQILATYAWISTVWIDQTEEAFSPDSGGGYEFYRSAPWDLACGNLDLDIVLPLSS